MKYCTVVTLCQAPPNSWVCGLGVIEGWSLTDYPWKYKNILQILSTGLESRLIDGDKWYKDNHYLYFEDRIFVLESRIDGCLQWAHTGHTGAHRSVELFGECFHSQLTLTELRSFFSQMVCLRQKTLLNPPPQRPF